MKSRDYLIIYEFAEVYSFYNSFLQFITPTYSVSMCSLFSTLIPILEYVMDYHYKFWPVINIRSFT